MPRRTPVPPITSPSNLLASITTINTRITGLQEEISTMTTAPAFTHYVEPAVHRLADGHSLVIGIGELDNDDRSLVEILLGGVAAHLTPKEAREVADTLNSVANVDDGDDEWVQQPEPRPGQTFPASTPLDTLKHVVLSAISRIEFAQDRLAGEDEETAAALDDLKADLLRGLAEHVEGINPAGLSDVVRGIDRLVYDNGGPVRLNINDGGTVHEIFPRLRTRSSLKPNTDDDFGGDAA